VKVVHKKYYEKRLIRILYIELSCQIFTFEEELFEKKRGKKKLGKAGLWPIALGL
jgi:hypothetical protein